jgi:hypothetical protein
MTGQTLTDLTTGGAALRIQKSSRGMQNSLLLRGPELSIGSQGAVSRAAILRSVEQQALGGLGEHLAQNLAIFPKTGGIIANEYGVYVPNSLLGQDVEIRHEIHRAANGVVCVTVSAYPRKDERSRDSTAMDCSAELRWLREHRLEYAGEWVALDGDKLVAHGVSAKQVYEAARMSGIDLPLVTQIEAADELPFGGW